MRTAKIADSPIPTPTTVRPAKVARPRLPHVFQRTRLHTQLDEATQSAQVLRIGPMNRPPFGRVR